MIKKLLMLPLLLVSLAAFGLDLHQAKEAGLVGETDSGYLAAVTGSSEAAALVQDINAQRKAEYQRIAQKNNIALRDVELLAGKKAIEKTPAGQYVKVGGSWQQK